MLVDDISQELNRGGVELALLQFEVKLVSLKFLKDLRDVLLMFREVSGVNNLEL